MADWKAVARARALGIPDEQMERISPVIEALEKGFSEIATGLPDDLGMSVDFTAEQA